jgi:ribosome-associated protein
VRSSGPGGQNANKVASKALLRWSAASSPTLSPDARRRFLERFRSRITAAGEIVIASDRHRDRERNRADCLDRLKRMLAEIAVAAVPRRKTKPRQSAIERRLRDKRARARRKQERHSLDQAGA